MKNKKSPVDVLIQISTKEFKKARKHDNKDKLREFRRLMNKFENIKNRLNKKRTEVVLIKC